MRLIKIWWFRKGVNSLVTILTLFELYPYLHQFLLLLKPSLLNFDVRWLISLTSNWRSLVWFSIEAFVSRFNSRVWFFIACSNCLVWLPFESFNIRINVPTFVSSNLRRSSVWYDDTLSMIVATVSLRFSSTSFSCCCVSLRIRPSWQPAY